MAMGRRASSQIKVILEEEIFPFWRYAAVFVVALG